MGVIAGHAARISSLADEWLEEPKRVLISLLCMRSCVKRFVSCLKPAPEVPLIESLRQSSERRKARETEMEMEMVADLNNWSAPEEKKPE